MKSTPQDKTEGMMHQVEGKVKDTVGRVINNPEIKNRKSGWEGSREDRSTK